MTVPPIVLSMPGMEAISPRRNLVYKTADGHNLLADLYLPCRPDGLCPAVILIHGAVPPGEAVRPKDWAAFDSWGRLFADTGMAAVAFNHRMSWNNGFDPANLVVADEDVQDLITYMRQNGAALGIDRERICLFAFSAGGPMLARPLAERPEYVRCYIGFYPFLGNAAWTNPTEGERFSPTAAVGRGNDDRISIFIARAGLDMPMLNQMIDPFVAAARAKGAEVTLVEHPNGRHGFDFLDDDETSRMIIRQAVEFARSNLLG
jgi:acetyl esterase/lipase